MWLDPSEGALLSLNKRHLYSHIGSETKPIWYGFLRNGRVVRVVAAHASAYKITAKYENGYGLIIAN